MTDLAENREALTAAARRWVSGRPGTGGVVLFGVARVIFRRNSRIAGPVTSWNDRARYEIAGLAGVALILTVAWVVAWMIRRFAPTESAERSGRWFKLPRSSWSPSWWPVVGLAAVAVFIFAWHYSQPHLSDLWAHGNESSINDLGSVNADTVRGYFLTVVIGAPVLEEVFYRGCLQSWLARRLPAPVAVVAATAVFTAAHGTGAHAYNSVQLISVAVTGLTFGVLYHRSGSLIPGIAAHMALNGATLAQTWGGMSNLWYAAALAVIAAVGLVIMGPRFRAHRGHGDVRTRGADAAGHQPDPVKHSTPTR